MDNIFSKFIYKCYRFLNWKFFSKWNDFKVKAIKLGYRDKTNTLCMPSLIIGGKNVYLYEFTTIFGNHTILSYSSKFTMKKYSIASNGLTVVTGNHVPTVGIPMSLLAPSHINDKEEDVIVDEDVWIGTGVTLLSGAHVGRGCVVGAKALINKKTKCPPYAVVVGCPGKIVAAKFTIDQILEHEKKIYLPEERLSRDELESIFKTYYEGKRTLGVDFNLTEKELTNLKTIKKDKKFKYPND